MEAQQDLDIRDPLTRLVDLLWLAADGPTRGVEPESWELEFEKLWQMSQLEESQARKTQAETDAIYIDTQVLMPDEVASSRFGGDTYSYETQLDEGAREEADAEPEPEPEPRVMPPQLQTPAVPVMTEPEEGTDND